MVADEKLRLVYHYSQGPLREVNPKYMKAFPDSYKATDIPTLNNIAPYTLVTWPSLNYMKKELGEVVQPMRFRCNLHINTDSGTPFQEDHWDKIRQDLIKVNLKS